MAVIVEITSMTPDADPVTPGTLIGGQIVVALNADYEAPVPFTSTLYLNYNNEPSREKAIANMLDKIVRLAEQIIEGANQAKANHPSGG